MQPTLRLLGATVPSYAVFVLAAFVLAILVWRSEVRRLSLAEQPANRWIAAAALLGAIVGSKLGMALFQTPIALGETFHRAFGLDFSGKTVVGALLGAIAAVELAKKGLGIRQSTGDQFAIAVPLGFAVGRIGCLFNGCCYGIPAHGGPLAVDVSGVSRQPVQLYEALLLLTLAALLHATRLKPRPGGRLWRLFLVGFCGIRSGTEFLRGDPSIRLGPLSLVQIVCAVLGVGFGVSLLRRQDRIMLRQPLLLTLILAIALVVAPGGCRSHPKPAQWDAHIQGFLDHYFRANPTFAVYQGKHEYDGQFPDWSAKGIETEIAWLHGEHDVATRFDVTRLDERQRFQRTYLLGVIDRDLFWLEEARFPWKNPAFFADALDPNVYVARPYAPLDVRMKAVTTWARNVPAALGQIRATLRTPMPLPLAEIGRIRFGGMVSFLESDVPPVFAEVKDPAVRSAFATALKGAAVSFRAMGAWFESLKTAPGGEFALGPEKFQKMLWMTERVSASIDEVEASGRADLARNRKALEEECGKYAPAKTLEECMEKMNAHKSTENTVDAARAQLAGLKSFILDKDLVTIPGTEQVEVRESPPYMRWNFAYIDPPGPYEHGLPSVYYVAPPDPSWTAKDRAEYLPGISDLLFTTVHEVWPGHFLQFLHANRSPDLFGRVFVGYAFAEGWAHYAEEMMWEAGVGGGGGGGDAETHIGQLSNALLRDARLLSAIGLHARGMSLADAETFFRVQGLQPAATARQQAARGAFDPPYLNYTLGKLLIRQLRDDWTRARGGRKAWKAFHDAFLTYGGPPIGLMRGAMMGPGSVDGGTTANR